VRFIRKTGPRKTAALLSVAALALAMTGILYAHWTDTLEADIIVGTGSIDPRWTLEGTSDDFESDSFDNEPRPDPEYDRWGDASSGDQTLLDGRVVDLLKDVGICRAGLFSGPTPLPTDENDGLVIRIENGYPSYFCHVKADLHNFGTVPVKLQRIGWNAARVLPDGTLEPVAVGNGPTVDGFQYFIDDPGDGDTDLELEFSWLAVRDGARVDLDCGYQLDPGDEFTVDVDAFFHVDQDAMQNMTYQVIIEYDWVNWNEYDDALCLGDG
jgi:hypothetical protein